ncbi:S-layer homology domain-containing protein [Paenibacillus sp. H1-7]|uniref:S-layer homology domain-containing protein n=1 Tax=Paenibacillus sp. H1-7 TaxID=2282849 RepID=UPI001EF87C95|nr:S-layer homology domain-containing protein [Paenibacillus sp. H1-7]ULL15863.1 S-layer homology domain-containing protein [Paenibacillus sp. H1-7]
MVMKKFGLISLSMVLCFGISGTAFGQSAEKPKFSDVKGHWAESAIMRLVNEGILDGFPDGTFRPDEPVTADQFVKMLLMSYTQMYPNGERKWTTDFVQSLSAMNKNILQQDYRTFDFKPSTVGYWAKPYIDLASDLNFISKTQFPDFKAKLKREQVAEIIYYTAKETEYLENEQYSMATAAGIGDLQSAKAREQKFVAEAFTKGIMEGYPNGYFGIGRDVTRAESLTILERIVHRDKRINVKKAEDGLEKIVPTKDGSYKKLIFPDQKMLKAYDVLQEAAKLRGTNYDLEETTLKLYKDAEMKAKDLSKSTVSSQHYEEASLWLEPEYKTYGVTVHVQEGMLARNKEAIKTFTNYLFSYDALTFDNIFLNVYNQVVLKEAVETQTVQVGNFSVEIHVEADGETIVFSILEKNG